MRLHHDGGRRILPGTDDEARGEGLASDDEIIHDVQGLPATPERLPAPDEVHDFDRIALSDLGVFERRAFEHDEIVFDGHASRVNVEMC